MNKIVLLVLAGILLLSAQSCSSVDKFNDAKQDLKDNTATPNNVLKNAKDAKAEAEIKTPTETEAQQEAETTEETEIATQVLGLVPATNPEIRVRSNVRGRQDPFSVITVQPKLIQEETDDDKNKSTTSSEEFDKDNTNRTTVSKPQSSPPAFEPTLAQNVIISGLIEVDGRPKLIVEAPEESSSRYVEIGQYLSNGQILVKSIDMNHFPTPLVILEQSGVEVAKAIGEKTEELSAINSNDSLSVAALTR
jgi:hypothetical protein